RPLNAYPVRSELGHALAVLRWRMFLGGKPMATSPESALALAETLIHFAGRLLVGAQADQAGRNPGGGTASRHGFQHDAAGSDLGASANLDVAEHASAGPDHDAFAYLRVAVAGFLAGSAKRHALEHGDAVPDHSGLANHDAGAVVNHDAATELCCWVDVD